MRDEHIDGVRVLWDELPGPYQGALVVGCGAADEDIDQLGLTTLVVKLIVEAVGVDGDDVFDTTDQLAALIHLTGSPDDVTDYFTECCAVLADLPMDDLADAAREITPVDRLMELYGQGAGPRDPRLSLLARRFGRSGPGLLRWPVVGYREFTVEEVRAHAARYCTAENMMLVLNGAPARELRLPLPPGEPVSRASAPPTARYGDGWYSDEVDGVGIAISGELGPAAVALHLVLNARVQAEVRRNGLEYRTNPLWMPVDQQRVEFGVGLLLEDRYSLPTHAEAARMLARELRELASEPPDRKELEAAEPPAEEPTDHLYQAAQRVLVGVAGALTAEDYFRAAEVSPGDVRAAAASWLTTATIVAPPGTEIEPGETAVLTRHTCPVSHFDPAGIVLEPLSTSFWRRRRKAASPDRLVLGDDACHLVAGDGSVHTFPMADAIVVDDGPMLMLGNLEHGCLVNISAFGGREMLADSLPARRYRRAGTGE